MLEKQSLRVAWVGIALVAALALSACSDSTAPIDTAPSFAKGGNPKLVTERTTVATSDDDATTATTANSGSPRMLQFAEWAPPLQTYEPGSG